MTMIDPAIVPQRTLYTGAKMPAVGMGTFGSDHADADAVSASVAGALRVGYRSFDCAAWYFLLPPKYGTICMVTEMY